MITFLNPFRSYIVSEFVNERIVSYGSLNMNLIHEEGPLLNLCGKIIITTENENRI